MSNTQPTRGPYEAHNACLLTRGETKAIALFYLSFDTPHGTQMRAGEAEATCAFFARAGNAFAPMKAALKAYHAHEAHIKTCEACQEGDGCETGYDLWEAAGKLGLAGLAAAQEGGGE